MSDRSRHYDVVIIGAGLSGLFAATVLADTGAKVYVIGKGGGYLHFTSGCVDVMGRDAHGREVEDPLAEVGEMPSHAPSHPYAHIGQANLRSALARFVALMMEEHYPFDGEIVANMRLPTAIGSHRTTCLTPRTMTAGNLRDRSPMLIAGFTRFRDFYPPYAAANLSRLEDFEVKQVYLDQPQLSSRRHLLPLDLAHFFDHADFRQEVARLLTPHLKGVERVGLPAVLGIERPDEAWTHLQELIARPIFEIPTLPPSVPGIRIHRALRRALMKKGARLEIGFWAHGEIKGSSAVAVSVEGAGRPAHYEADAFILATGGTGGGGIRSHPDGQLHEEVFDLAVIGPDKRSDWFREEFVGSHPQPVALAGVRTCELLQPYTRDNRKVENLFVTASNLPAWEPTREKSGEGVALGTGWMAAQQALAIISKETTSRSGLAAPLSR